MQDNGSQITTITFFRYKGLASKLWAFWMMQFAHGPLSRTRGLQFYKLMGSGKEGFNPLPDWSVYGLLQVWESQSYAHDFFLKSQLIQRYHKNSAEQWTLYMRYVKGKGKWSGRNPFMQSDSLDNENAHVSVITRATIKWNWLIRFWKYVPASQRPLIGNKGLIYTKGIGEVPFTQMATFSVWKDKESLQDFAYRSQAHQKAIQMTKEFDWYKEEMFCRFQPYRSEGSWNGVNPLSGL